MANNQTYSSAGTDPKESENVWALGKLPRWYNSGYDERDDGTFISVNAKYAEEEGRFSAGTFRTRYSVSKKAWTVLLWLDVIKNTEWHHTGKAMRKTEYYGWGDYNVCDYTQGTVEEGSFGDIYLNNKKTIDKLTDKIEEADWEYEEEKAIKDVITIDGYIESSFRQRKDEYLSDEEKDNRTRRHHFISDGGWEIGTPFERKLMHEEVDGEFDKIARDRFDRDLPKIKAEYEQQYGAINKENEEINKHNALIREKNAHTHGKERAMLDILDLFGYDKESAISKVTFLSALALAERREKQKYEDGKVIAEDYKKRLVALAKRKKTWFDKKIKEGSIVYRERLQSEPEFFVKTLEEMHGRYGWFVASYRYNLPTYYSGYVFDTKTLYNKYLSFDKERINILDEAQKNGATMDDLWSLKGIGTVEHDNAYYRARIQSLRDYAELSAGKKKFYQNGLVPKSERANFDKYVDKHTVEYDNSPLTFTEQMTYNTWYEQHPEKVAGTMVEGSSLYFPVVVRGNKSDVEAMFEAALSNNKTKTFRESVEENGDNNESKPKYKVGDKFALRAPLKTNKKSILYIEVVGVKKYEDLHPNVQLWQKAHRNEYFYLMSFSKDSTLVYSESRLDKYFELVGTSETSDDELEMLELEAEALELELEISKK